LEPDGVGPPVNLYESNIWIPALIHNGSADFFMRLVELLAFLEETPLAALDGFKDGLEPEGAAVDVAVLEPLFQTDAVDAVVVKEYGQQ